MNHAKRVCMPIHAIISDSNKLNTRETTVMHPKHKSTHIYNPTPRVD